LHNPNTAVQGASVPFIDAFFVLQGADPHLDAMAASPPKQPYEED
jgi:hypothetical protein